MDDACMHSDALGSFSGISWCRQTQQLENEGKELENEIDNGGKEISTTRCGCFRRLVLFQFSMAAALERLSPKGGWLILRHTVGIVEKRVNILGFDGNLRDRGAKNHKSKDQRKEKFAAEHGVNFVVFSK